VSKTLTIRQPDDFHLHLRQGAMLQTVAPFTKPWGRVLVMPNLSPNPVLTADDALRYQEEIQSAFYAEKIDCTPLMTIQLTENTTPEMILDARKAGVIAAKVYPKGQTTNSENGVEKYDNLYSALSAMQDCGMVLCLHGEHPRKGIGVLDREAEFLSILHRYAFAYPRLRIVLEHVTTKEAVEKVCRLPDNVAATVTLHHLMLNLDNVIGDRIQPHHFCKPVAKPEEHRLAIESVVLAGNPKFFFGSDSAPHLIQSKIDFGCAGIFTAPVALPLLAELFYGHFVEDHLENFVSVFGASFYGLPLNEEQITLERDKVVTMVQSDIGGIKPFYAGKLLYWNVSEE
jgi:dihydroorotase